MGNTNGVNEKIIITFGTFDLYHIGHKNILERASKYGDKLYVGVSSDWLTLTKKGILPVDDENKRINKIKFLNFVTDVFLEESLELKSHYIKKYNADILIMGDDWKGKFDNNKCKVIYLSRTENISSSILKNNDPNLKIINKPISKYLKLNGTYFVNPVETSEIFPLKKYDFYGYKVYGPNKYDTMYNYYSSEKCALKYAKVKWTGGIKNKEYTKFFDATRIKRQDYIRNNITDGCNKNMKACVNDVRSNKYIETNICPYIPECCRHHLNDILLYTVELLEKNNILYFAYWGTLLGCIRHKGSIPWDTDHDIYILDSQIDELFKLENEINKKYIFKKVNNRFYRIHYSKENNIHVDIYIADQLSNNKFSSHLLNFVNQFI